MTAQDGQTTEQHTHHAWVTPGAMLLVTGCCALVYQVCWLRGLRLVFGASTAANAAVLAIFMGGLGLGALRLGPWADRHRHPLALYGKLELCVAVLAGLSPFLIDGIRWAYAALGGTPVLGVGLGTGVRLLLSTVVLGVPTFLMGGTLPAVVRAVQRPGDPNRRNLGLLYAMNTLGSVGGVMLATFLAIEWWGIRQTLWTAVVVNAVVAATAIRLGRRFAVTPPESVSAAMMPDDGAGAHDTPSIPSKLVLLAAGLTGFVFLLMELVWYRMLAPLLGGSSYSFGMILAVALLGIGVGGLLYGAWAKRWTPTPTAFAFTAVAEALFLALPLALGDDFALLAAHLRSLGADGFGSLTLVWFAITSAAILLPALVAGFQFPLLVALLGRGQASVGEQVGQAYAFNTLGAILGSLAGGFGLLPLLGAVGAWRVMILVMAGLGVIAVLWTRAGSRQTRLLVVLAAVMTLAMVSRPGPTAVWRHTAIGAGRSELATLDGVALLDRMQEIRRSILWETDGVESSIALQSLNGHAFVIHGKVDGHALGDAPTNLWLGLLPTLLHPEPEDVLVIGLGTGQTAGWAAAVPSVKHVDVVELEPAIARVAQQATPTNRGVMQAPNVHIHYSDAREWLTVTPKAYDVIVSEPSNPYRAGIASLFSEEFYRAARTRLGDDGIFLQWVQAYELSHETLAIAMQTLRAVFPHVEIWEGASNGDLLVVAAQQSVAHDAELLADRVSQEPWRSGLAHGWRVSGLTGLYAGYVGGPALVEELAGDAPVNVDDHPVIEFGFARQVGDAESVSVEHLRARANQLGLAELPLDRDLDPWQRLEARHTKAVAGRSLPGVPSELSEDLVARMSARVAWASDELDAAGEAWDAQAAGAQGPLDDLVLGEIRAAAGDPRALDHARALRTQQPTEALLIESAFADAAGDPERATETLLAALSSAQTDPWVHPKALQRGLQRAVSLAQRGGQRIASRFLRVLTEPFAVGNLDETRRATALRLIRIPGMESFCAEAFSTVEPFVYAHEGVLAARVACYARTNDPRRAQAERDLARIDRWSTRGAHGAP